jgi:hypothetical protein
MRVRRHRGDFEESMATQAEVNTAEEFDRFFNLNVGDRISFEYYQDGRNDWKNHWVLSNGIPIGTSDGTLHRINHIKESKKLIIDKIVEAVREDLLKRSEKGIEKYGVTLNRTDLSIKEWLQHAYEECLDMANYLKKSILELDKSDTFY